MNRRRIEHWQSRLGITEQKREFRTAEDHRLDFLGRLKPSDHSEDARAGLVEELTLDKLGEIPLVFDRKPAWLRGSYEGYGGRPG